MTFCHTCHQPIRHRLGTIRDCEPCKAAARQRRQEAASKRRQAWKELEQAFAAQRNRIRWKLRDEMHTYRQKQAAAQENSLTSAYTLEQRGYTFGGSPSRTQYQIQED